MIYLIALMMTVPPVPHPPAEQLEAATDLLQIAPIPSTLKISLRDDAISLFSYQVTQSDMRFDSPVRSEIKRLVVHRVEKSDDFDSHITGCMIDKIGWAYDLPTLKNIRKIVTTPGGQVLWAVSICDTVKDCYSSTLTEFMGYTGLDRSVEWFVGAKIKEKIPVYDAANMTPKDLANGLSKVCGLSTGDALTEHDHAIGIKKSWADTKRNSAALSCLVSSARLSGYDLTIFDNEGGRINIIM